MTKITFLYLLLRSKFCNFSILQAHFDDFEIFWTFSSFMLDYFSFKVMMRLFPFQPKFFPNYVQQRTQKNHYLIQLYRENIKDSNFKTPHELIYMPLYECVQFRCHLRLGSCSGNPSYSSHLSFNSKWINRRNMWAPPLQLINNN